jgi:hypothetical protein
MNIDFLVILYVLLYSILTLCDVSWSTCITLAPVDDLRQALLDGHLGSLNPLPWAVMTGNCLVSTVLYVVFDKSNISTGTMEEGPADVTLVRFPFFLPCQFNF